MIAFIRPAMPGHRAFIAPCVQHRRASVNAASDARASGKRPAGIEAAKGRGSAR